MKYKPRTEEHSRALADALRGRTLTEEHKKNISNGLLNSEKHVGGPNPGSGRPPRTTCALPECGVPIPPRPKGKTGKHPMYCSIEHRSIHERRAHLKKRYGMTNEEYFALLEAQDGRCAICRSDDPKIGGRGKKTGGSWAVDHDHETGAIRGLLCSACNRAIGQLRDSSTICEAAAAYLRLYGR